ncbi:hypothetical protein K435DRAFT_862202 [Dendrothele bispora CBS 962.96]|uniref:Uncharacterized protein n=1 Tax=Dendrothele bispora (strain CBS 962.96) TaxID=1314807 RepID=A0A4V6T5B8_DENBC|nr:hypothetical protein K435DRAFT_862202 [Dendrothele bispora CBS 962.96]
MAQKHAILHVVQASYGDALLLEYDPTPTDDNLSKTVQFIVIDGGPSRIGRYYVAPDVAQPKHNLFTLLNWLSGDGKATKPAKGLLKEIDTVVLTHDDEDHKQGIQDLFTALLLEKTTKKDEFNTWLQGDRKMIDKEAPVKHIWYNRSDHSYFDVQAIFLYAPLFSLKNVSKAQDPPGAATTDLNWFDQLLDQYASRGLAPPLNAFNDELAVNSKNAVTLAMRDAKAKATDSKVIKSQFVFTFIGPSSSTMANANLVEDLGGKKSIRLPYYRFTQGIKEKTSKLSNKILQTAIALGTTNGLSARIDSSIKNRSSIAFSAEDTAGGISMLSLGDGNASMFYDDFKDTRTIMHHGSYHNNFWSRDSQRKAEEQGLSDQQKTPNLDNFQRDVIFFFAKVQAKKYIISASALERHPNPHSTTMIGIIAAARENQKTVDIYLTNPLAPWVIKAIGLLLTNGDLDLKFTNIRLLGTSAKSGSVALYCYETDSDWELFDSSGKDIWTTYSPWLDKHYPEISKRKSDSKLVQPPKKKPKSMLFGTTLVDLRQAHTTVDPSTTTTSSFLEGPASRTFAATTSIPLVVPRIPPNHRTILHGLFGTAKPTSHEERSETEPYPTRILSDFPSTLQYLVEQGVITQASQIEREATSGDGFSLAAITALFLGHDGSEAFLSALPCDLGNSTDYLSSVQSPAQWTVNDFSAKVVDLPHIAPSGGAELLWNFPFGTASPNQVAGTYCLKHEGAIDVSIIWPAYTMRMTSGGFRGTFRSVSGSHNIVGQFTMMYDHPTQYSMKFSDESYDTQSYTISIADLLVLFNSSGFNFTACLGSIIIPGLEFVLGGFNDTLALRDGGFILERILSKVVLKQIFADLPFDTIEKWQPFGSTHFSFDVSKLHIVLNDIGSVKAQQLILQLNGDMNYADSSQDNSNLDVPFQLTAEFTLQGFMLYEVSVLPGTDDLLSVGQLLDITGLSSSFDLAETFPAVSNLSNALNISHVTIGWTSSVLPDYFKLMITVDDWTVLDNVFSVRNLGLEIQAGNLSSEGPKTFSLHGWGALDISDIEVEVYFNIVHDPSAVNTDVANFQIASQEQSVPLGLIIAQFLGENITLFPKSFESLLQETALDSFILQATRDESGWSISQLQLALRIEGQLDIFNEFNIAYPTLSVNVEYPFDQSRRTIYAGVNATVHIGDIASTVEIVLSSAEESKVAMVFTSGDQPLTLSAVLTQFISNSTSASLPLPPMLTFLADLGLQQATLTLGLTSGKFSLNEMSVAVISTSTLKLWEEITLENVSLLFSYSKSAGKHAEFDAILSFKDGADFLNFTLQYDGPSASPSVSTIVHDPKLTTAASDIGSWQAQATYDGTISVLDILSRVSGLDIRQEITSISVSNLRQIADITITNLLVSLIRNDTTTAFTFDADTEWLFFSHLRFACSKSSLWSYSFGFDIRTDTDLGSKIAVFRNIASVVSFTDMSIVIFNNVLDPKALPQSIRIPKTISQDGANVAFAGKLVLSSTLKGLKKVTGSDSETLDILGIVGDEFLSLSVSIQQVSLFHDEMLISGAVVVICSEETEMLPEIGVKGTAVLNFGDHVSKDPITTSLFLLIDTSTMALGFKFQLDKWEAVFGFNGLNFENVLFAAEFPPEEFPIPSSFTVAGAVNLQVNDSKFDGSVNIHFVETNLSSSYASGHIDGLTLNNIVRAFSDTSEVPDHLDAGFGPLDFKIVPKDLVDEQGQLMKQEFMMKGSMQLPVIHFDADVDIDITRTNVVVDGHLSPIIVIHERLFSILASPEEMPPPPSGTGASIHVSVNDGTNPSGAKVSGQFTFLGISNDIFFNATSRGLEFTFERDQWITDGSLSWLINSTHLILSASYNFSLHLTLPAVHIGSIYFGDIDIASFSATLDLDVTWSDVAWSLGVAGQYDIFGLVVEKSLTVGADMQDLVSMAAHISSVIQQAFNVDLVQGLRALRDDLKQVLDILEAFGIEFRDMVKFLIESCEVGLVQAIDAVKQAFNASWDVLADIIHYIGETAENALTVLEELGCADYDLAVALGKAFGTAVRNLCGEILKDTKHDIVEIAKFFKNLFNDDAQEIIGALLLLDFGPIKIYDVIVSLFEYSADEVWRMINHTSTKKTLAQVQEELLLTLTLNVNKLSSNPITMSTADSLSNILQQYGSSMFSQAFHYTYTGVNTTPPLAIIPPVVKAMDSICSFTDGQSSHIDDFYARSTFDGESLESWMEASAKGDLLKECEEILQIPTGNEWQVSVFDKIYISSDKDQNSVHANAILVCVNGSLSEDAWVVTQNVIYYIGDIAIADDTSLTIALGTYGRNLFKDHFLFAYDSAAPDLADAKDGGSSIIKDDSLGYFEDQNIEQILSFVKNTIFSKLSLPDWVTETAMVDILNDCKRVYLIETFGTWNSKNVEYNYEPTDGASNPIKCKAVMVYYTDTKTTEEELAVAIAYIFFMGMYYEVLRPTSIIYDDLIKVLCTNIQLDMDGGKIDQELTASISTLKTLLERYARARFSKEFEYIYAGDDTQPGDKASGALLYGANTFHEFQDIGSNAILTWVNSEILKSDEFPLFNQVSSSSEDLLSEIKFAFSTTNTTTFDNHWGVTPFSQSYVHPTNADKTVKTAAILMYANGSLTEGKDTVKSSYMYYMGVYYVADASIW